MKNHLDALALGVIQSVPVEAIMGDSLESLSNGGMAREIAMTPPAFLQEFIEIYHSLSPSVFRFGAGAPRS
jgi:hypothetical protein